MPFFDISGRLPLAVGSVHGVVHGLAIAPRFSAMIGVLPAPAVRAAPAWVVTTLNLRWQPRHGCRGRYRRRSPSGTRRHKVLQSRSLPVPRRSVVVLAGLLVGIEGSGVAWSMFTVEITPTLAFSGRAVFQRWSRRAHQKFRGTYDAALGLVAGGDGGGGGQNPGRRRGAVVGGHAAHLREAGAQVSLGHSRCCPRCPL